MSDFPGQDPMPGVSSGFLETAARPSKPRSNGITHVIDRGFTVAAAADLLSARADFVDIWKFGFGSAVVDMSVSAKVDLLRSHHIKTCPGGTLLEAAWWQRRCKQFFEWAHQCGFDCVEVSRGATAMPQAAKLTLIAQAIQEGFEVLSEIGSKDPQAAEPAQQWFEEASRDSEAGARWLVAEGRDSGTVGLYRADGSVRAELVEGLANLKGAAPVVYEAPRSHQQAWLVNRLGPSVNLANIDPVDLLAVETLRRGLRADTLSQWLPRRGGESVIDETARDVTEGATVIDETQGVVVALDCDPDVMSLRGDGD